MSEAKKKLVYLTSASNFSDVGGGWVGRTGGGGGGGANTFNNKERVYSRAIAFSNRRCSVPLESTLPNISAMYIWLIRMYIA